MGVLTKSKNSHVDLGTGEVSSPSSKNEGPQVELAGIDKRAGWSLENGATENAILKRKVIDHEFQWASNLYPNREIRAVSEPRRGGTEGPST